MEFRKVRVCGQTRSRVILVMLAAIGLGASAIAQPAPQAGSRSKPVPPRVGAETETRRGRTRPVSDTTQYPWSAVCKIIATFPDETTVEGAGTMIGPHHCLTALHLLYDTRTRKAASRVRVIPGYDDDRLLTAGLSSHPFGSTHINQFLFWEAQDIAIIVTSENIGEHCSWMTVGSRSDRDLTKQSYMLAGYSGGTAGSRRMLSVTTTIVKADGDRLTMNGDGAASMEGGPIFFREARGRPGDQDVWSIVGVQTGADRGSRIPAEMRHILERFLHDDFSGVNAKIPIPSH